MRRRPEDNKDSDQDRDDGMGMSGLAQMELLLARSTHRLSELIMKVESRPGELTEGIAALRDLAREHAEALATLQQETAKAAAERAELREAVRQVHAMTSRRTRDLRTYISRKFRAMHYTPIQVEECPNCASIDRHRIGLLNNIVGAPAELFQCDDCALGYVSILVHPDDLARYYADGYDIVPSKEFANARAVSQRNLLFELLEPQQRSRVFEIGAGTGALLRLLSEEGAEVAGVEPRWAIEDLDVVQGEAEDIAASGDYNLVVLSHLIEHIPRPHELLAVVRQLLRPGGHLFLEVPNFESADIKAHEQSRPENAHVLFFTAAALENMLHRSGFQAVTTKWSTPSGKPPKAENIVYTDGSTDSAYHVRILARMLDKPLAV